MSAAELGPRGPKGRGPSGRGPSGRSGLGRWGQRWLVPLLAVCLVLVSAWCVAHLLRSLELQQELHLHRDWLDDMYRVRRQLEQPPGSEPPAALWPELEGLRRSSRQLLSGDGGPGFEPAVTELKGRLDALRQLLGPDGEGDPVDGAVGADPASVDGALSLEERRWDASFRVLRAAGDLERQVEAQVDGLHGRLEEHWGALNLAMLLCVGLCASNLALLHLARRRRLDLESARDHALTLTTHDPLTGVLNRDAILGVLRTELARAQRLSLPLGLILADVDDFKRVNAMLGQQQGDDVLREVSRRLGSLVRPYDTLGRFGGDSFLVVLPTCDADATARVAGRLEQAVEDEEIDHGLGRLRLSLSLAYSVADPPTDLSADLLLHRLQETLETVRRTP
ncbi:MAG: GGDEF domain-containing protein [Acidobacteriota bacterium]